ncbi:hypothetical protein M4D81_32935 [Paenibacillus sp. p3-SID867]|uniref:MauE/DoxX family redox-associated membrane protein n=1 Tax=Paenibacillus sp. p3-SID867 TaxID=2916363 RepID=UPI0021A39B2F|nr:MauE/DoxX family redox-associated membrane protein [Paenibacillus sp. p3-SID867]MCT1403814.1 hypothetical protein [Paenibacillus sp. p3-SID867]
MIYLAMSSMIAIMITFFFSGTAKVIGIIKNGVQPDSLNFLPRRLSFGVNLFLPFLELLICLCLGFGWFSQPFVLVSILLFFIFLFLHLKAALKNSEVTCNCFGNLASGKMGWGGVMQNILLIAYCLFAFKLDINSSIGGYLGTSLEPSIIILSSALLFGLGLTAKNIEFN